MYRLLKLTNDDVVRLIPPHIRSIAQYIRTGGCILTVLSLKVGTCGTTDCLDKNCKICRSSIVAWRKAVKTRDHYACINCGPGKSVQAHHLLQRVNFPEKAFDVANGITLCEACHRLAHSVRRAQ